MPYLALPEGGDEELDATRMDEVAFNALYKKKLVCPECIKPIFPRRGKAPSYTLHFFHGNADCPTSQTKVSQKHLAIQAATKTAINMIEHWSGRLEWSGDRYRADVMALYENKPTVSVEIQLSHMDVVRASERTQRHLLDGVARVIWLLGRDFHWSDDVPSARLNIGGDWKVGDPITVTYKMLPPTKQKDGQKFQLVETTLEQFIEDILARRLLAREEKEIVVYNGGEPTIEKYDKWVFETAEQVKNKTNSTKVSAIKAAAYKKAMERERRLRSREEYIRTKRQLVDDLMKLNPGLSVADGWGEVGYGAVAIYGDKTFIVQPVTSKISTQTTPLIFDDSTYIIYRQNSYKRHVIKRYRGKLRVLSWSDVKDVGSLSRIS